MPDSCCAVGCSNKREKGADCKWSFYRIPFGTDEKSLALRKKWVAAIKREKWTEKAIDNARICSDHFITGKRSNDPNHPDYVPLIFTFLGNTATS